MLNVGTGLSVWSAQKSRTVSRTYQDLVPVDVVLASSIQIWWITFFKPNANSPIVPQPKSSFLTVKAGRVSIFLI